MMVASDDLLAIAKQVLHRRSLTISSEVRLPNESGWQLRTREGPIVNCYDNGNHHVQGRNHQQVKEDLARELSGDSGAAASGSRKVFVVYGHDTTARTELEAMLRRWHLEPILLDQLPSEGNTLIEQLEKHRQDASFAVVLATPDDEGHRAEHSDERKYRARQNVVLELGMMLAHLGRPKVAILMKRTDPAIMERPSDIQGLIYIPFTDSVSDARIQLAQEMERQGLTINMSRL